MVANPRDSQHSYACIPQTCFEQWEESGPQLLHLKTVLGRREQKQTLILLCRLTSKRTVTIVLQAKPRVARQTEWALK